MFQAQRLLLLVLFVFTQYSLSAQETPPQDYGKMHPDAPAQLKDYQEMIGLCSCKSVRRNADGTWPDSVGMSWQFRYMLGGYGVQDESWKEDDTFSGSVRQYNSDSSKWVVTYFSSGNPPIPSGFWTGAEREGDKIVLYRPQQAPNGMDGYSRLQFYDISETGFKWIGEWVSQNESVVFPFWKINCKKLN